jgi:hypothetical protein
MMRFRGGGVGHKSTREATNSFRGDRDRLDKAQSNIPESGGGSGEQLEEDMEVGDGRGTDEDEEEDFGYVRGESESEEGEAANEFEGDQAEDGDEDFGPEDDGVDPDMMAELGYGSL